MTFQIGDLVCVINEKVSKVVAENFSEIQFKIYLFEKNISNDEKAKLVLIVPQSIILNECAVIGITDFTHDNYMSVFHLKEPSYNHYKIKSELFKESDIDKLFIWIPEDCLSLVKNKQIKNDGCFCVHCHNFSKYAEPNFGDKLLCWGCNVPMNRTIHGLD